MARFKVAMTETAGRKTGLEADFFASNDVECVQIPGNSAEEIIAGAKDCDGIIVVLASITDEILAGLPKCKVIVRRGIGLDNIDLEAAARHKIMVANVPDYCFPEVADHTLALFLTLCRKIHLSWESTRQGKWDKSMLAPIPRIDGKVFGIMGCGAIGRSVARRAAAFGLTIHGFDPFMPEDVMKKEGIVPFKDLHEFLASVDFLSLHSPLTPDTKQIINAETLGKMKPGLLLINAARGGLIDEAALYEALKNKVIAGAALDVLCDEPPKEDNPLATLGNVIITPHVAFYSVESNRDLAVKTVEEVLRTLVEGKPRYWVNKAGF